MAHPDVTKSVNATNRSLSLEFRHYHLKTLDILIVSSINDTMSVWDMTIRDTSFFIQKPFSYNLGI